MIISAVYITGYSMGNEVACFANRLQQDPKNSYFSENPTELVEQVYC